MGENIDICRKVLIITNSLDYTVNYIMDKYPEINFFRLNVDHISEYEIIIGNYEMWEIHSSLWSLKSDEVYSIYYRKPRFPDLTQFDSRYQGMIVKDIMAVINGIVDDFDGKVLTKPYILRKTENKVYQLLYAKKEGIKIPKSYIGNSNNYVDGFVHGDSIIKPITTGKVVSESTFELYQTAYFKSIKNEDISLTPVYLQEYVRKKFEVRLTYVNGKFFAVRIDADNKLDWRAGYEKISYSIIDCPEYIQRVCLKLLNKFKLHFGAFDFIVNENGEWIFLEINPNGQWQWLEKELNIPISKEIVKYLVG